MSRAKRNPSPRLARLGAALAAACLALALAPASAPAEFGDAFGIAPINGGPSGEFPPALADVEHAFWAGACDRGAAPPAGESIPGGIGTRPTFLFVPTADGEYGFDTVPAPAIAAHCIDRGREANYPCSTESFPCPGSELWAGDPAWRLAPETRAGAHPDGTATFYTARNQDSHAGSPFSGFVDGALDNVIVELPPGFLGDPQAVAQCTGEQFAVKPLECPPQSQVGMLILRLEAPIGLPGNLGNSDIGVHPVYNLEPRRGKLAEFGIAYLADQEVTTARLIADVRTKGDFGVTILTGQIPAVLPLVSQQITLWGVPWAASNDEYRAEAATSELPLQGLAPAERVPYDPSWGPVRPLISNPTGCTGEPTTTTLLLDSYVDPAAFDADGLPVDHPNWKTATADAPPLAGCEDVPFEPEITLRPTSQKADSPTGLEVELTIPQNDDLPFDPPAEGASQAEIDSYLEDAAEHWRSDAGLATSHLKDTVVTLPEGMAVSPSAAWGLEACTTDEMGLKTTTGAMPNPIRFDNQPVSCPDGSTIGTLEVDTPLLADPIPGRVYLAAQDENPFSTLLAIYLVAEDPERGIRVKLAGEVEPDPDTGQLTTTFLNNPQLPFETFRLRFKGGSQASLVNPPACGAHTTEAKLTPWARPDQPVTVTDSFQITKAANGGPCPPSAAARAFDPGFNAKLLDPAAATSSSFFLRFTRDDGDQELVAIDTVMPEGVVAKLAGVPRCSDSDAEAGTCPLSSVVGGVTAGAGPGPAPFFIDTGRVFLTGPYKGAPLGLLVEVPAKAGPFDLGEVLVRAAIHVDPRTAQVTVKSDPMPLLLEGIPLRTRDVRVNINRPDFVFSPTSCEEDTVGAVIFGTHNASADRQARFQITGCSALDFAPEFRFHARGKGATKPNAHPGLLAEVFFGEGQTNIAKTSVVLPPRMIIDQQNIATTCTRQQFAQGACPENTQVGEAIAHTPLLSEPLQGPVYLIASDNPLPDIVADLEGIVDVHLFGRIHSQGIRIRNTFDVVPDAPVESFRLSLEGGRQNGILVNGANLCRKPRFRRVDIEVEGHNGASADQRTVILSPRCLRERANRLARKAKQFRQRAKRAARNGNQAKAKKLRQRSKRLERKAKRIRQNLRQGNGGAP